MQQNSEFSNVQGKGKIVREISRLNNREQNYQKKVTPLVYSTQKNTDRGPQLIKFTSEETKHTY